MKKHKKGKRAARKQEDNLTEEQDKEVLYIR
jgi:hypothetical protein